MNNFDVIKELKKYSNKKKSLVLMRFFKTGKGEYGEGDKFMGVIVPEQRKIAKKYQDLNFSEIKKLLSNPFHEVRLTGLFILVYKYEKGDKTERKKIYNFYIKNIKAVNNWDLVDATTPNIIGRYLWESKSSRQIIYKMANSKNLWERRIAILATYYFIKNKYFKDTVEIARSLLKDEEDLIHKAVGWMLREVGRRDEKILIDFLDQYVLVMSRTTLRYSLEKLSEKQREYYINLK